MIFAAEPANELQNFAACIGNDVDAAVAASDNNVVAIDAVAIDVAEEKRVE